MPQTNYLALTIGPIYETMKYCQKTRELWVGSYFFSYFMRTLIDKVMADDIELILPYVDEDKTILTKYREEGVFHDRFIAKSSKPKEELKELIEDDIANTIKKMIEDFKLSDTNKNISMEDLEKALDGYLQYHYIIATEDELLRGTKKPNIVFAIDTILDSMELENSFDFENSTKVCEIDQKDYKKKKVGLVNPLAKLQYEAREMKDIPKDKIVFKPIPKIAIANIWEKVSKDNKNKELLNKLAADVYIEKEDEEDIYDEFYNFLAKEYRDDFKPHHKYYAVIYADGDKMGRTIRSIYEGDDKDTKIEIFSKNLYEYISHDTTNGGKTSLHKVFDDFGGMLVFAGGDDMLAFAPIFGKDDKTIFDLLEALSERFTGIIGKQVSLSFGLNINYYKSPMIEAINTAYNLLMKAKKNNTDALSGSVALSLTKHSGQSFDATFFLGDDSYKQYQELFKLELNSKKACNLPHNIHYSLKNAEYLICDIYNNNSVAIANSRIDTLFEKSIKDDSHSAEAKCALEVLKEYIKILQPKDKEEFEKLISQLAIIKFLRGDQ